MHADRMVDEPFIFKFECAVQPTQILYVFYELIASIIPDILVFDGIIFINQFKQYYV